MLQVFGETFFAKIVNAQQKKGAGCGEGGQEKNKRREKERKVEGKCHRAVCGLSYTHPLIINGCLYSNNLRSGGLSSLKKKKNA